mgnify:CR=1 FL=1
MNLMNVETGKEYRIEKKMMNVEEKGHDTKSIFGKECIFKIYLEIRDTTFCFIRCHNSTTGIYICSTIRIFHIKIFFNIVTCIKSFFTNSTHHINTIDINGNICRLVLDAGVILKQSSDFSKTET